MVGKRGALKGALGAVALSVLGAALGAGLMPAAESARRAAPVLPLHFAHNDHRAQNCIGCHHDYVDRSGAGQCINCHKTDPEVSHRVAEQFHGLCQGCHLEQALAGQGHGPLRNCQGCHVQDDEP